MPSGSMIYTKKKHLWRKEVETFHQGKLVVNWDKEVEKELQKESDDQREFVYDGMEPMQHRGIALWQGELGVGSGWQVVLGVVEK